ncbi:DUF2884 family protein [Stenotrophomonas mori]|uniref:YggN family protein n=1 Tax=Stenotrophomonas mori TaxID=2871096 RepID=A0ABT0SE67_9GAMM|nr:DUF2884 family protein [Stenotrophomonas mori]MCL7713606.1 YggN family protein [Stenotrophomonas mori]
MNLRAPLLTALLCLPLAACGDRPQNDAGAGETRLGQKVREATDKARQKIAEGNISVSSKGGTKVEIAPNGQLYIDGRAITLDDRQRTLLTQYRGQLVEVAEAGIEIGVQGANLGARAAGEALKGLFSGDTDRIEERVEADAKRLQESAAGICDRLPAMLATQQRLAAAIPEFAPYATLDQDDIDECRKGHLSLP